MVGDGGEGDGDGDGVEDGRKPNCWGNSLGGGDEVGGEVEGVEGDNEVDIYWVCMGIY